MNINLVKCGRFSDNKSTSLQRLTYHKMGDLPVLKKCCFCVPLRYGLLIWGYLKLAAALILLSFLTIIVVQSTRFLPGVFLTTIISLVAVILVMEIVFHVVFIIGAHKKIVKLLRVYYYYAQFMWLMTMIMSIVATALIIRASMYVHGPEIGLVFSLNILGFFFSIVVQTNLVLSVRSEIIKLRSNCPYRFVKNDNDPEGTINSVKDDEEMSIDNGTVRIL